MFLPKNKCKKKTGEGTFPRRERPAAKTAAETGHLISGAGIFAAALCLSLALAGCSGSSAVFPDNTAESSGASAANIPEDGAEDSSAVKKTDGADAKDSSAVKNTDGAGAETSDDPDLTDASGREAVAEKGADKTAQDSSAQEQDSSDPSAAASADAPSSTTAKASGETGGTEDKTPRKLKYIDAWKEWHVMEVDPSVRENTYDPEGFSYDSGTGRMTYTGRDGSPYEVLQGVDVSEHQGWIDWEAVAGAGYQFAFIRVGYRGYGEAGNVFEDNTAVDNLRAAKAAGLQVGAYFFSQALSEEEAREEAAVALDVISQSGVTLDLPLMYDPEIIKDDWGRANDITREQVTLNTAAFQDAVETASPWQVDIYSNLPWEHHYFDADTMNEFDIWYADYERTPQTPYHFVWWQYTNEGSVPGMEGAIDLNLWIRPLEEDQP